MAVLRLTLSLPFLASEHAPRMSIFTGATSEVIRANCTIYPPLPFTADARFHWPVHVERLPQGHLELAARRVGSVIRGAVLILAALVIIPCVALLVLHWGWNGLAVAGGEGLLVCGLVGWLVGYAWPRSRVELWMVDRREHIELRVPPHLKQIHDTYKAAYEAWIADGMPRHFPDDHLADSADGFADQIDGGWDQSKPRR